MAKPLFKTFDTPTGHKKFSKKFLLILPYIIMTLLFLVIPLIMVIIKPFQGNIHNNWSVVDGFIWKKIFLSIFLSLATTIFCIIFAYPFAYFLTFNGKKVFRAVIIVLITTPTWSSFLIKLIGLKTFFDICNGQSNSTFGHIFTIIGLTYIYIPFMILPIYNVLNEMPKNLLYASKDLGYKSFATFIKIVIPYTKTALYAGITLVFLPCITTVAVPQFLNNNNNASTIAEIIVQEGEQGLISKVALARASSISLVTSLVTLAVYLVFALSLKLIKKIKQKMVMVA